MPCAGTSPFGWQLTQRGMEKHAARLEEERARPLSSVCNNREVGDGVELVSGERRQRRNLARSAGGQ